MHRKNGGDYNGFLSASGDFYRIFYEININRTVNKKGKWTKEYNGEINCRLIWSPLPDLNQRPSDYESPALTN